LSDAGSVLPASHLASSVLLDTVYGRISLLGAFMPPTGPCRAIAEPYSSPENQNQAFASEKSDESWPGIIHASS
jgi:hypothetical protein